MLIRLLHSSTVNCCHSQPVTRYAEEGTCRLRARNRLSTTLGTPSSWKLASPPCTRPREQGDRTARRRDAIPPCLSCISTERVRLGARARATARCDPPSADYSERLSLHPPNLTLRPKGSARLAEGERAGGGWGPGGNAGTRSRLASSGPLQ